MGLNRSPGSAPGQKNGKRARCDVSGDGGNELEVREIEVDSECPKCFMACEEPQKALQCYLCEKWFHNKCVGVADKAYEAIAKLDNNIEWVCATCKNDKHKLKTENSSLKKNILDLKNDNKILNNAYQEVKKNLDNLKVEIKNDVLKELREEMKLYKDKEQNVNRNNENSMNLREEIMKAIKEEEERKERKYNLVIYNLEESKKQFGKDRDLEDLERIKDIFNNSIKVENFQIVKSFRMGRKQDSNTNENTRSRPVLIKMSDEKEKWNVLKNAKELKDAEGWKKKIGISPDLCKEDREKEKQLRTELKQKRENGERNWYIRNGKLCKRDF